jgi:hypothetical protein
MKSIVLFPLMLYDTSIPSSPGGERVKQTV